MTALDHLRKLVDNNGQECKVGSWDGHCNFCGRDPYNEDHAPGCPWVAAKGFVEAAIPPKPKPLEPVMINRSTGKIVPRGFTLIEILVALAIVLVVSVVALPMVIPALSHRQVSEAARLLSAQLAGARDASLRDNAPRGIRLLPDPAFPVVYLPDGTIDPNQPLAASRIIPIGSAPDYSEGLLNLYPGPGLPAEVGALPYSGPGTPAIPNPTWGTLSGCPLMVSESPTDKDGLPGNPTSWFWNIRIGDQIQINHTGPWYTVVGPMIQGPSVGNAELFVNVGPPGTISPYAPDGVIHLEFLLLVNGKDDNQNGWKSEGWDGVDNDGINGTDDAGEWETETP